MILCLCPVSQNQKGMAEQSIKVLGYIREPYIRVPQKECSKRSSITFFAFGTLSVTFSDASVTFFVTFLPNSFCRTPFAQGDYKSQDCPVMLVYFIEVGRVHLPNQPLEPPIFVFLRFCASDDALLLREREIRCDVADLGRGKWGRASRCFKTRFHKMQKSPIS